MQKRRLKDRQYAFLFDPPPENEVVVFDCETSGLDPKRCELLAIGAIRIRGQRILTSQKLELVIKPTQEISAEAIKVHKLRHQDVANGLDVQDAITQFLHFIGSRPLVGYYLEFDVAMINKYIKPWLGITLPNPQTEVSELFYNARMDLVRGHPNIGHVDLRFDTIMEALALPRRDAHDAINDALMTAMMYLTLLNNPDCLKST
jgi:DNA polymerase-3 subunit epsilon